MITTHTDKKYFFDRSASIAVLCYIYNLHEIMKKTMLKKRRAMKARFQHGYSIFSVVHEFNRFVFRLPFSPELDGKMWQTGRGASLARWWPVNCRYEALPVVSTLFILTFLFPFYIYWYENKQHNVQNSATGLVLLWNYFNGKSYAAWTTGCCMQTSSASSTV